MTWCAAPAWCSGPDGTWLADARTTIEEFESRVGPVLTEDERAHDIDTLGGLVMSLTDRVPSRGELVTHSSGIAFEVIDADPRRIKRLRVRNAKPVAPTERGEACADRRRLALRHGNAWLRRALPSMSFDAIMRSNVDAKAKPWHDGTMEVIDVRCERRHAAGRRAARPGSCDAAGGRGGCS